MFIGRALDGSIYGCWSCPQPHDADHPGMEEVEETHPDLVAYLTRPQPTAVDRIEARLDALEQKVDAAVMVKP